MRKRFLRQLCLVMAVLLAVLATVPAPTGAAASAKEIEQQITRTYRKARSYYGWSSFDGFCGALVNAQLYLMGITSTVQGNNGNEEFDAFYGKNVTDGGYKIRAYPAATHTLLQALNEITDNGTRDVYNVLVGFQETKSSQGKRYGHACVVHAILDGQVYFVESYSLTIDGRYYPEGTPIHCSIESFADYYGRTTVLFDGVIHFTQRGYAEFCRSYPTKLEVTATGGNLWSQPCESRVDSSSTHVRSLKAGDRLAVTGLYLNTEGEYWYQVGEEGYVRADQTQFKGLVFDDITVTGLTAPTLLRQGKGYSLSGQIRAQHNEIYTVRAQVFRSEEQTQVLSATETVESKSYDLSGSDISRDLAFRKLPAGQYRFVLAVIVGANYVQGGRVQTGWETVTLHSSEFQVMERTGDVGIVTFEANGGAVQTDQIAIAAGEGLTTLPQPRREGFVFQGWYYDDVRVEAGFVPEGDVTLYAHWIHETELLALAQEQGRCSYYHCDGLTAMGCIEIDGLLYYFSTMDTPDREHILWTVTGTVGTNQGERWNGGNTGSFE